MTREEFNGLSEKVRAKLLGLAARYKYRTGLADEPEDVVQEALLTLWRLSQEGYPIRDAEGLAVKITKNLAIARLRKQKLDFQSLTNNDIIADNSSASDRTDARDNKMIKEKLYADLTPTQRKYLELRSELGLSLDEIAATTGKPKTSIKTTISSARRQMLEQIKKQI